MKKRCFGSAVFLAVMCCLSGAFAQSVDSTFSGTTDGDVYVSGQSEYYWKGTTQHQEGLTTIEIISETQALTIFNFDGTVTQFDMAKSAIDGAYDGQTLIEIDGQIYIMEKVGSAVLVVFKPCDESGFHDAAANYESLYGMLTESAAGTEIRWTGQTGYESQFGAGNGGASMQNNVNLTGQGAWQFASVMQVIEGFGPAPGTAGPAGSVSTMGYEDHVKILAYDPSGAPINITGVYIVDMTPENAVP